jgi:CubicO group peptidase (beta-lactamase class C family)
MKISGRAIAIVAAGLALGAAASCLLRARTPTEPVELERIEKALAADVVDGRHAGVVAGVATSGGVVYRAVAGHADLASGRMMATETRFRLASMTKPIITAAVMRLAEDGALSLDDPVARFIPEFADARVATAHEPGANGVIPTRAPSRAMLVRDLLNHTSGIGYVFNDMTALDRAWRDVYVVDGEQTLDQLVKRIAALPLYSDPGAEWGYSYSIDVAGRVVEVASGKTLEDYLRDAIFAPLGMTHTNFLIDAADLDGAATLYWFDEKGVMAPAGPDLLGLAHAKGFGFASGGAGLVSTLDDYLRYCRMMLRGGELDGARVLSEQSVKSMTSDQIAGADMKLFYENDYATFGFGGSVVDRSERAPGLAAAGEWSWSGHWDTWFVLNPADDVAVVLLAQTSPTATQPQSPLRDEIKKIAYDWARR